MIICCLPTLLFLLDCYTKATLITWFLQYIHNIYIYMYLYTCLELFARISILEDKKTSIYFPWRKSIVGHWVTGSPSSKQFISYPLIRVSIHPSTYRFVYPMYVYTLIQAYIYIYTCTILCIYIYLYSARTHIQIRIYTVYILIYIYTL